MGIGPGRPQEPARQRRAADRGHGRDDRLQSPGGAGPRAVRSHGPVRQGMGPRRGRRHDDRLQHRRVVRRRAPARREVQRLGRADGARALDVRPQHRRRGVPHTLSPGKGRAPDPGDAAARPTHGDARLLLPPRGRGQRGAEPPLGHDGALDSHQGGERAALTFQDHFSDAAGAYATFRPHYPDALFAFLAGAVRRQGVAWDCATGSGRDTIGPYWPPERRITDERYRPIAFPFAEVATPEFTMEQALTLDELAGYVRTWSGTRRYVERNGCDPVDDLVIKLREHWADPAARRVARWPVYMRAGRVP